MPFNPLYMTESVVSLDGTAYEAEVSSAKLTPSYSTATFRGLKAGSVYTRSGKATWVLTLGFGQDHESATALSVWLHEHEGETVPYVVKPVDGGAGYSGTLIVQAGEIGGDVDQFGTASVSLPVIGKPLRTPAA